MSELADQLNNQQQQQQQQQQQDPNQQQQDPNQQQQQVQRPAWMDGLTDPALRDNARLTRLGDIDALAKSVITAEQFAHGRVALPKEGDDASYQEFIAKVRPETADAYQFEVPEGSATTTVDAFRPFAHQIGLTKQQGEGIAKWFNQHQADAMGKLASDGKQALQAYELEIGPEAYNTRLEAAGQLLTRLPAFAGEDNKDKLDKALQGLEQTLGPRASMELLFSLAEATGELQKVDGDQVALRMGGMSPQQAQARINEKMGDDTFMQLASQKGTREAEMWNSWNRIAAGG